MSSYDEHAKLRPEVKEKWITALRSGEYDQTDGMLRRERDGKVVGYCCLGVLCDLAAKEGVGYWADNGEFNSEFKAPAVDQMGQAFESHSSSVLPEAIAEWAGLQRWQTDPLVRAVLPEDNENGYPAREGEYGLAELNDNGFDFNQIADVIERQL